MQFDVLTIFPAMCKALTASKIYRRAIDEGLVTFRFHDLRDYTTDKHRSVDDEPFGGGAGMIMKPEPLVKALEEVTKSEKRNRRIYLTPKGRRFTQKQAKRLLRSYDQLILLCGRYQGVDQRVIDGWIDEEISLGDFVLSGGELPAMAVVEAVTRLIPGVLGNRDSLEHESFTECQYEAPKYTRPRNFRGLEVPEILLTGDHGRIKAWEKRMRRGKKPRHNRK